MISPHELKNKAFTRVMRGYNPTEVDEHIAFLLSEYTDLYKENDELTRRIAKLEEQLETYSRDSEAIRSALMSAQKVSTKIVDEANEKAELIVKSVKENCDKKLEEVRARIKRECEVLDSLRAIREKYEKALSESVDGAREALGRLPSDEELSYNADEAVKQIMQGVRDTVAASDAQKENTDDEE